MKDILGRELKVGDLVVCMAIGRNSKGMFLGIQTENNTVKTMDGIKSSCNRFLVTNPSDDELELMEKIKKKYKDEEIGRQKALEERRSKKAIPYKDLQFCHIYEDDKGDEYVFLGICEVSIIVKQVFGRVKKNVERKGYTYIPIKYNLECFAGDNMIQLQSDYSPVKVLKSRKKLVKDKGLCESLFKYIENGTNIISRTERTREYSYYNRGQEVDISYKFNRIG